MRYLYSLPLSIALRLLGLALVLLLCVFAIRQMVGDTVFGRATLAPTAEEQTEIVRRALEIDSSNGPAWYHLAKLNLVAGDLQGALDALARAKTTMPSYLPHDLYAEALYARAYRDVTTRYDALEAFDRALSIFPQDNKMLNRAGRIALWLGDPERARAYMEQADVDQILRYDWRMQNPDTIALQADIELASGNLAEAEVLCRRLNFLDPLDPETCFLLANVLLQRDPESREAYSLIRRAWIPQLTVDRTLLALDQATKHLDWEFHRTLLGDLLTRRSRSVGESNSLDPVIRTEIGRRVLSTVWRQNYTAADQMLFEQLGPLALETGNAGTMRLLTEGIAKETLLQFVVANNPDMVSGYLSNLWAHLAMPMADIPGGLDPFWELDDALAAMMVARREGREHVAITEHFLYRLTIDLQIRERTLQSMVNYYTTLAERMPPTNNSPDALMPMVDREMLRNEGLLDVLHQFSSALVETAVDHPEPATFRNVRLLLSSLRSLEISFPDVDAKLVDFALGWDRDLSGSEQDVLTALSLANALAVRGSLDRDFPGGVAGYETLLQWLRDRADHGSLTSPMVQGLGDLDLLIQTRDSLSGPWKEACENTIRHWAERLLQDGADNATSSVMMQLLRSRRGGGEDSQWRDDLLERLLEARQ